LIASLNPAKPKPANTPTYAMWHDGHFIAPTVLKQF